MKELLEKYPTRAEYDIFRGDNPSSSSLIAKYGSWREVKREFGLDVPFSWKELGDEELEDFILKLVAEFGSAAKYAANKPASAPSINTIISRYGSWSEAKRRAKECYGQEK